MNPVSDIVDPGPIIAERLKVVAGEYEPRLAELERAIDTAIPADVRRLKRERRRTRHAYARARRRVQRLSHSHAAW
jgi:hypothetical protein